MERLTVKDYPGNGHLKKCSFRCVSDDESCCCCGGVEEIVNRLGQVEDILGDEYDLKRLRELVSRNE